jgi:TolB-like protein
MLYEMSTGRAPFAGEVQAALVNEVLNHAPVPPRRIAPTLSVELEALTLRCLDKVPARRPSTGELTRELRRLVSRNAQLGGAPIPRIESIAVLPLENLSRDPEQEYFADGMTEALIADLAGIRALRVVSRTSAMHYKGARRPLPEIARELGVDAIVEGSVLKVGPRVRITAQLIEASTDHHLWAERYERDLSDVLAIQSEVAQAIVREIQVQLTQQERTRLGQARRVDPEAHEAYLKGRYLMNRRTIESLERALVLFERAIERDPTYAPAFSGLADTYNILADFNHLPPEVVFPRARAAAERALALDDQLAEAHVSLAYLLVSQEWNWEGAEREFRVSIALDQGYATAHQWYASLLTILGRFEEAIAHGLESVRRDPLSFILYSSVGDSHYYARRFDDAIGFYRRAVELAPNFPHNHLDLGRSLEAAGRFDEAMASYRRGLDLNGESALTSPALACLHAAAGRPAESRTILEAMRLKSTIGFVPVYAFASVHARLGEIEPAIAALEAAFEARDRAMVFLNVNPRFDVLREQPRFRELVRRMRLGS